METLIASAEKCTESQKKNCVRLVTDATEKTVRDGLDELDKHQVLTKTNIQQVQASGDRIASAVAKAVQAEIAEIVSGKIGRLRRIAADKRFIVAETNGTETLANASDVFGSNIDRDFRNWGCDGTEAPTERAEAHLFEMCENGNYRQVFGSFGVNVEQLCWTTPQIKKWVAEYAGSHMREDGWAVFLFLFKVKAKKRGEKNEFFVADVDWAADGDRGVAVVRFAYGSVWLAENRYRVVVPQPSKP